MKIAIISEFGYVGSGEYSELSLLIRNNDAKIGQIGTQNSFFTLDGHEIPILETRNVIYYRDHDDVKSFYWYPIH